MRIAIFSDNFYPEISGISDSILLLAKELAKNGNKIEFYVPKYSAANYKKVNLPNKEINLGKNIAVVRLPSIPFKTGTSQGRGIISIGFSLKHIKKFKPDVIHTQSIFGAGVEALLASKIFKIPLIGTNHTVLKSFMIYSPIRGKLAESAISAYNSWYYNRCNLVTSPGKSIIDSMKKRLTAKNMVVPNPIELSDFKQDLKNKKAFKKKFALSDFSLIYAGRLAAEKNIEVTVKGFAKAAQKIPNMTLAIAGKGSAEDSLRALVKSLKIENKVKFLGFLNQSELIKAYNASEIFIITSRSEVHSLSVMQAMACGLPIIGVNAGGLPKYIKKEYGYIVGIEDTDSIAKIIIELYNNPQKRLSLSSESKKAIKLFTSAKIAKRWEKVYGETIKNYKKSLKT